MVRWSIPAKNDLKRIYDYISIDSKVYAKKVSQDIVEKTETLNDFPKSGRVVPEIGEPNIREIIIYSYRLVYEIYPSVIEVLGILHGKQDFPSSEFGSLKKQSIATNVDKSSFEISQMKSLTLIRPPDVKGKNNGWCRGWCRVSILQQNSEVWRQETTDMICIKG